MFTSKAQHRIRTLEARLQEQKAVRRSLIARVTRAGGTRRIPETIPVSGSAPNPLSRRGRAVTAFLRSALLGGKPPRRSMRPPKGVVPQHYPG